jgi:hypothetical protein
VPWVELPIWKGNQADAQALNVAIGHNCDCQELKARCASHRAMLEQRFIDGILWARWMRERLEREEGLSCLDI